MTCDSMLLKSISNGGRGVVMQSSMHPADGNLSDESRGLQLHCSEPQNSRGGSLSSATECTNDRRLDVTRAASECSVTDDDDDGVLYGSDTKSSWSADDLKLEMDVLETEHNLLRVQKELALQNMNNGCVERNGAVQLTPAMCTSTVQSIPAEGEKEGDDCGAFYKIQHKETAPNLFGDTGDMLYSQSRFAQEALLRLRDISNENACRVPLEDPTCALQDRLQKLLLAAVLEHECPALSGSQLGFEDARDTSDWLKKVMIEKDSIWNDMPKDERCLIDSAAHRKELDLISLKVEQAKAALASQNGENRSCFKKHSQQTLAEEMYCKQTIRQIVQQVQAEIEQWSQMQDILRSLQEELEGLNELQKLWADRALRAEAQLKCLQEEVHQWRCRAWSFEEQLVMLRCEKQILKNKINMVEDAQLNRPGIAQEVREKPRCASVGTQHDDFALCESFVHSRNESGRSSVDLGTSTQKSFRKSIKKSLDFVSTKNSSNPSKFLFSNLGLPKVESTGLEFSSKKVDAVNSKGKPKSHKSSGHFMKKVDSCESAYGHDHKERKKARLFASKENRSFSGSIPYLIRASSENPQDRLLGHVVNAGQDYTDGLFFTKPKSSLPSAPASTPSRIPFGDIVNISKHDKC